MTQKSKTRNTQNTSATATPVASADVLATAAAPAAAEAIAPLPAEGATSVGEAQVLPPPGGEAKENDAASLGAAETGCLMATHEVTAIPHNGFCRAGRRWPAEGTPINRADWTDEQWLALTSEANLIVRAL